MDHLHAERLKASCRRLAAVARELRSHLPPGRAYDDLTRAAVAAALNRSMQPAYNPIAADHATLALAGKLASRSRDSAGLRSTLATLALCAAHIGEDVRASRRDNPSTAPVETQRLLAEGLRTAGLSSLFEIHASA